MRPFPMFDLTCSAEPGEGHEGQRPCATVLRISASGSRIDACGGADGARTRDLPRDSPLGSWGSRFILSI